jgi:hypothetical protein
MKSFLIGLAVMAAALAGGSAIGDDVEGMTVLQQGNHSDIKEQTFKDIHNQADLAALWAQMYAKLSSPPAVPQVDWTKQMVIAFFMGDQKHGGYRIRITKAAEDLGSFNVDVTVTIPGQNCNFPHDDSQPYIVVALPASTAQVNPNIVQKNMPPCGG